MATLPVVRRDRASLGPAVAEPAHPRVAGVVSGDRALRSDEPVGGAGYGRALSPGRCAVASLRGRGAAAGHSRVLHTAPVRRWKVRGVAVYRDTPEGHRTPRRRSGAGGAHLAANPARLEPRFASYRPARLGAAV